MHPLESKIANAITRHNLISPHERNIIVAVSGGADSVALLAALTALGYNCVAAHCNFHLRGEESNRDTRHVADICDSLGIDLSIHHCDVDGRRRATGESVEMACRSLRYEWFGHLADSLGCCSVAVAHHRSDNIETAMLNLVRGTGLAGLSGMKPRNGLIIRPMLECTRAEIEKYLHDREISWVTDSTNASNDYMRNRMRNIVLPQLEQSFPHALEGISASMSHIAEAEDFYRRCISEKQATYTSGEYIDIARLAAEEPSAKLLLFEWLHPLGFSATQVTDMLSNSRSGATFVAGDRHITINRGIAEITMHDQDTDNTKAHIVDISRTILTPAFIDVSQHGVAEFSVERDAHVLCIDTRALEGDPVFELRHWQRGDTLAPFGMQGTRKVSDIFTDAKLSTNAKKRVWLLTRNGTVLWVAGLRTSRHFAITPETKHYLRLQLRDK